MWTINIIIHNIGSTLLSHLHKHTISAVHLQTYTACEFIAPVTIIYYYIIYIIVGTYVLLYYLNITLLCSNICGIKTYYNISLDYEICILDKKKK